jgi:hypothetical protein
MGSPIVGIIVVSYLRAVHLVILSLSLPNFSLQAGAPMVLMAPLQYRNLAYSFIIRPSSLCSLSISRSRSGSMVPHGWLPRLPQSLLVTVSFLLPG